MQGSLRLLTSVALTVSLLTACGRKKQEQTESLPAAEESAQMAQAVQPANSTAAEQIPGLETAPASAEESTPKAEIPVPADSPMASAPQDQGISADLIQSDAIYEAWFRKYNLDLNDPTMLDADLDGDGVSNRDEFMADTNPRDAKSLPAQAAAATANSHGGLKLKEFNEVQVPVLLESVDGSTARIKRLDQGEKIETVRAGQTVQGLGLRVEKVQSKRMTDKYGSGVDASRVVLENPATKEKTLLVKDMPARSGASSAVLISGDGQTTITVRQGEIFQWPQENGSTFKVIDLRADQVVLQDESTGRMWTVSK